MVAVQVRFLVDWSRYRRGAVVELPPGVAELALNFGYAVRMEAAGKPPEPPEDPKGPQAVAPAQTPPDAPGPARRRGRPPKAKPDA